MQSLWDYLDVFNSFILNHISLFQIQNNLLVKICEIIIVNRFLLLLLNKPGLAGLTDFKQFYKLC